VYESGGAEGRDVAQEFLRDFERARMERADLPALQWGSVGRTQLVEVAEFGRLDEILRVAEQVDDGHDADAGAGRGFDEADELFLRIGIAPRHAGQARKLHGVLEMKVKFLVTPVGVARQPLQQKIQPFNLAGEIPLKSTNRPGKNIFFFCHSETLRQTAARLTWNALMNCWQGRARYP